LAIAQARLGARRAGVTRGAHRCRTRVQRSRTGLKRGIVAIPAETVWNHAGSEAAYGARGGAG